MLDERTLQELSHKIIDIAEDASESIMEIYRDPEGFAVERKDDHTPVTRADQVSSRIIEDRLQELFPEALVVSEEGTLWSYDERKRYDYIFLVDPLDGTKEFVKGNDEFCINIALLFKGKAILGVIYTPVKKQAYFAYENGGAWQFLKNGKSLRLESSGFNWKDTGLRFIVSRSHMNADTTTFVRGFHDPEIIQRGSAIKFTWLSRGDADIYPKIGRTMEWDTAAGQIILEEAGGQVVEFNSRVPLRYNKKDLANPHFLAHGNSA